MVITRLGAGVDRDRRLAPEAVSRTLAVLEGFREVMDAHSVKRVRAAATSAVRDAANGADFLAGACRVLGQAPELLSGEDEGRLSFRGATGALGDAEADPVLVVDIGGGSTELVLGRPADPDHARVVSVDIGCVRVTERFLASDPPRAEELAAARAGVDELLGRAAGPLGDTGRARRLIGLAGTVSAAAVLDAGVPEYRYECVHHHVLSRGRVSALLARLAALDHAGRLEVPGLEPERADVIVGGLVVLVTLMERFGYAECLASEADILDGLVQSLLT